ncbi:hypothetical protein AcV5_000011 [Taiwanofungus camphoratus]|nr:hypothetical protein AcV5_000011 [Antrodia cinnamomea]
MLADYPTKALSSTVPALTVSPQFDGYVPLPPISRRSKAAAAGLNIMLDSLDPPSDTLSPDVFSDRSSPSFSSSTPVTPLSGLSNTLVGESAGDGDGCWNLIPYNVPWGSEYHQYQAGTLPGPDGTCIFLRSPTPLKNRRTVKACNKCRERKAKCSGTQPTCSRCLSRGYICHYEADTKRSRGPALSRQRRRDSVTLSPHTSGGSIYNTTSSLDYSDYAASTSDGSSPKHEERDEGSSVDLTHPSAGGIEHWTSASTENPALWEEHPPAASDCLGGSNIYDTAAGVENYTIYEDRISVPPSSCSSVEASTLQAFPAVHAPRPVKCPQPVSFLSPPNSEINAGDAPVHAEPMSTHCTFAEESMQPHGPLLAAYADDVESLLLQASYGTHNVYEFYTPTNIACLPAFDADSCNIHQHPDLSMYEFVSSHEATPTTYST